MLQEAADKWGIAHWSLGKTLKVGCQWVSQTLLVATLYRSKKDEARKQEENSLPLAVPLVPSTDKI